MLDKPAAARVEALWLELEAECGLVGAKAAPFPHFSWQVAENYHLPRLETMLRKITRRTQPFMLRTAGLGLFTGENPIVYVSLVKDESLLRFHAMLWEQTKKIAIHPLPHYALEHWVPHITLAYGDVRRDNLGCALQTLAFQSFDWEIWVDNVVFIAQADNQTTETRRYRFGE